MKVENLNSHKYDVENCSKIVRACLDNDTYSSFRSVDIAVSSSSINHNVKPKLPKGFHEWIANPIVLFRV